MALSDDLAEATVRHSIYVERYKSRVVRQILALVKDVEGTIERELLKSSLGDMNRRDLNRLLRSLSVKIKEGYEPVTTLLDDEIRQLGEYETEWQIQMLKRQVPIDLDFVPPSDEQIYAATRSRPFNGLLLKEWYRDLPAGQFKRVRSAVRMGFVDGKTTGEVVRDVIGTRKRPGIIKQSRHGATAAVRTALAHTASVARNEVVRKNRSLIKGEEMVATLDSRTSLFCMGIDGKVFPIDDGPRPPFHINCRTTSIPVVKSARQLGLKGLPKGTRAAMNGQVSGDMNYNEWLRKQPREFQDEVLGESRAEMFRAGKDVGSFTDASGREYTLDELRQRDGE